MSGYRSTHLVALIGQKKSFIFAHSMIQYLNEIDIDHNIIFNTRPSYFIFNKIIFIYFFIYY